MGAAYLSPAINATHQHIDYYEKLQKLTLHRKRKVVADLEHLLGGSVSHLAGVKRQCFGQSVALRIYIAH